LGERGLADVVAGKSERSAGRPVAVRLFWRPLDIAGRLIWSLSG